MVWRIRHANQTDVSIKSPSTVQYNYRSVYAGPQCGTSTKKPFQSCQNFKNLLSPITIYGCTLIIDSIVKSNITFDNQLRRYAIRHFEHHCMSAVWSHSAKKRCWLLIILASFQTDTSQEMTTAGGDQHLNTTIHTHTQAGRRSRAWRMGVS